MVTTIISHLYNTLTRGNIISHIWPIFFFIFIFLFVFFEFLLDSHEFIGFIIRMDEMKPLTKKLWPKENKTKFETFVFLFLVSSYLNFFSTWVNFFILFLFFLLGRMVTPKILMKSLNKRSLEVTSTNCFYHKLI